MWIIYDYVTLKTGVKADENSDLNPILIFLSDTFLLK